MKTPDVTPAQVVALAGSIIATVVAFGLEITPAQQKAVMDLVQVMAPILLASDAVIRYGRAKGMKKD